MYAIARHQTQVSGPLSRRDIFVKSACSLVIGLTTVFSSAGCHLVSSAKDAIPANRLPPDLFDCSREQMAPVPFAALGQTKPALHVVEGGDLLSVFIVGVFPATEDETPILQRAQTLNQNYYPARGSALGPATGLPVRVEADGKINLPLVGRIDVSGLTVPELTDRVIQLYREKAILQAGRERVFISLQQPRLSRVLVLREDTPDPDVSLVSPQAVEQIHRGSGDVIDLPAYENDVLHALTFTGGLPGTDAPRELYVIRKAAEYESTFFSAGNLKSIVSGGQENGETAGVVRIPLAGPPSAPLPFTQDDITLGDGDVLYVPRRNEFFITGGLLPGGRVPLPRDEDVDVIEAIALATGSAGGPLGQPGNVLAAGDPGYIRAPTRVLVLRTLPDGRQMTIRCDLDRAVKDPKERIRIMPDDVVLLQFKPSAIAFNSVVNFFTGAGILAGAVND